MDSYLYNNIWLLKLDFCRQNMNPIPATTLRPPTENHGARLRKMISLKDYFLYSSRS